MLVDTHAHLDQPEFNDDRDEVIARTRQAGVEAVMVIGTTLETSRSAVDLAAQHADLYAVVGIQPNYCAQAEAGDWDAIVELANADKVVGLGETGLDRYWDYTPFDVQQDYFDRHLRLAHQTGLPFVVHCRESESDVVSMLREAAARGPLHGVMHSFAGDSATASQCLELGMFISFAGMVTFKKSDALRQVAASIPDDRILVETDSPYLSPHPLRGKRNEPGRVVHTARCLAEVRGQTFEEFAALTTANARRMFRLDAPTSSPSD